MAYIDNDAVVLCHLRSMRASGGIAVVDGDLADPAAVLKDPALLDVIDPGQPAAILLGAVLHFWDATSAREVVAGWLEPFPAGSAAVVSTVWHQDPEMAARMKARYAAGTLFNHSREDVVSFLGGLRLPQARVMDVRNWPLPLSGTVRESLVYGGVGLKP